MFIPLLQAGGDDLILSLDIVAGDNMRAAILLLLAVAIAVLPTFAQNPAPADSTLKFDVASVRLNDSGNNRSTLGVQPSGRVAITNMPLRQIIAYAYGIRFTLLKFSLIGGSDKLLDSRFDVQAVPPSQEPDKPAAKEDSLMMLRALLADRFGLRIRVETRQVPSYVLTVAKPAKLGYHFRPSEYDCATVREKRRTDPTWMPPLAFDGTPLCSSNYTQPKPGAVALTEAGSMDDFVGQVQGFLDRRVINETGLTGNFEWSVTFSINPSEQDTPPLPVAIPSELGLRVEEQMRPADVYVIDSLAMPTPN